MVVYLSTYLFPGKLQYLCSVATLQGGSVVVLKIPHMRYSGVHAWCIVVVAAAAQCISMDTRMW